jgi:hypothetical protein
MAYNWPAMCANWSVERAVVLSHVRRLPGRFTLEDEQEDFAQFSEYFVLPANATLAQIEREATSRPLAQRTTVSSGRHLNIGPATLYRKFKRLIQEPSPKKNTMTCGPQQVKWIDPVSAIGVCLEKHTPAS